jgi:hypothetical protein
MIQRRIKLDVTDDESTGSWSQLEECNLGRIRLVKAIVLLASTMIVVSIVYTCSLLVFNGMLPATLESCNSGTPSLQTKTIIMRQCPTSVSFD